MGRAGPKGCQPHSTHTPHFKVGDAILPFFLGLRWQVEATQTEHGQPQGPTGRQHWMSRSLALPPITAQSRHWRKRLPPAQRSGLLPPQPRRRFGLKLLSRACELITCEQNEPCSGRTSDWSSYVRGFSESTDP